MTSFNDPKALEFLSSRQALGDLAGFVAFATAKYGLNPSNKWISFGGSYPGMLAGWFRLKYPHLVHGSVASSAPVKAQLDMVGYNDVAAAAYSVSDNGVGGSPACTLAIAAGHAEIGDMFNSTSGRMKLSQLFGRLPAWYASYQNQADFAGNGVAYFPSQGNDPSCQQPGCNIASICKIMAGSSDNVANLAKLTKMQQSWIKAGPKAEYAPAVGEPDYWGYQTCTEFGFYQTCEVGSKCFYTQGYVTLDSMMSFCTSEFKVPASKVAQNINFTNAVYGADHPAGTCVLYPNGEVDPWHALSILESPSPGIGVLMVPGASHHAWTHPSLPTDQTSVVAARGTIRKAVDQFLQATCNQY